MQHSPSVFYIEDDDAWQHDVKRYVLKHSGINFRNFTCASSLLDVSDKMLGVRGPVILLVDLRLGQLRPNYDGYHWLLENLEQYVSTRASTLVYVLSGNLNEGIRETLTRRGIPVSHIYEKDKWAEQRSGFLDLLRNEVSSLDEIAFGNIEHQRSGHLIDPYLLHLLTVDDANRDATLTESERTSVPDEVILPMVVRTRTNTWDHAGIPGLQVLGSIENIHSCFGTKETLLALEADPAVVDVEASRSGGTQECARSVPFVRANHVHEDLTETGDNCIIGIIDSGIDVSHGAFRDTDTTHSRILAIWDQTDPKGPPPPGYTVGTFHTEEQIQSYIDNGNVPMKLLVSPDDHGTHVASIAAGRATSQFAGGMAPAAKLAVVIPDLEVARGRPQSLGYSNSHILALKFLREFAEKKGLPLVVNVSQGMNAGAHDGTSNLEKGFDLISDNGRLPGIAVVKSAGNERGMSGHAEIVLTRNSFEELKWESRSVPRPKDVIELWFKASNLFRFRLVNPQGEGTPWVSLQETVQKGTFATQNKYGITYSRYDQDNGDSRLLVIIEAGKSKNISTGIWSLEIVCIDSRTEGVIHAWLERDGARGARFTNHLAEQITLSIPATANYVVAVGAIGTTNPVRLTQFSSYGPTRDGRSKPDLTAPGEMIFAAKGNSPSDVVSMSGTSMAAPHVSGAIALLFSLLTKNLEDSRGRLPNMAQILAAITQSAQNYNGRWHQGLGFGVLDVKTFIAEFWPDVPEKPKE